LKIGEQVREYRDRAILTQDELGEKAGLSGYTISRIESNQVAPRVSTIRKIAGALGIEPTELRKASAEEMTASPKADAPLSFSRFLEERCGHAYLAMNKDALEEMFDALPEDGPERRDIGLKINNEYNTFCAFPRNVTTQERLSMRKMIRDSISEVAVKHGLALYESGLYPEYAEQLSRVFDLERTLDADEATA
jgi:transcriptional regulator with XRE-family HTH domain